MVPATGGTQRNIFDMTIVNTGDSKDAGSEASKIGNYDVTFREQERCTITKTKKGRIEGFPRKDNDGMDLVFLALYGALGKERCNALIKKMKKGVVDAKTQRPPKKPEMRRVYGGGTRSK
jgi:hypothetical protein